MPTSEVVALQELVSTIAREVTLHRKRLAALENSIAGGPSPHGRP